MNTQQSLTLDSDSVTLDKRKHATLYSEPSNDYEESAEDITFWHWFAHHDFEGSK